MRSLILILLMAALPAFAKPATSKVIISVTLSTGAVQVTKFNAKGKFELQGQILPVMGQSLHTGNFKPLKMRERFRSQNGNVMLENVILFDGNRTLRTSRLFERMKLEGRRVSGAIVLEPELGSLVFSTIRQYGLKNTQIRIRN